MNGAVEQHLVAALRFQWRDVTGEDGGGEAAGPGAEAAQPADSVGWPGQHDTGWDPRAGRTAEVGGRADVGVGMHSGQRRREGRHQPLPAG